VHRNYNHGAGFASGTSVRPTDRETFLACDADVCMLGGDYLDNLWSIVEWRGPHVRLCMMLIMVDRGLSYIIKEVYCNAFYPAISAYPMQYLLLVHYS
jgi:hypothetical protein